MLQTIDALGQSTQSHPVLGHTVKPKTPTTDTPADRWERIRRKRLCCKTCKGKNCIGRCRF
ncbi:MAG TPA: hypothetical protein VFA33_12865 [Bryobacteraceae bacterium]|nr:hypothetical protein [Bryobacteraceae bacterium]